MTPLSPRDYGWHPPALSPAYKSSVARAPHQPLVVLEQTEGELTGPAFTPDAIGDGDNNLLRNHAVTGDPIGERIILHGRVVDEDGRAIPNTLVEIWQANAGGRYRHINDGNRAALDPNFGGCGRTLTDASGAYLFHTVKPGAYPWSNGGNNWRPAHIHFSVFGHSFAQRLITQMYFQGDPLIDLCPIVLSIPDPAARARLVAGLDMEATTPFESIAYRFDIVLRGRASTPFETRPEGN
ncbi:MAG: protocatechuate 3,4-dioxygenase subunit beta [Roseobacter sp.]|jgi:protocatechuate 3,4-dioxygenase beta subunit|nr:protocatechuate 3,4-dioxygenase subunit beta [Roseobacter sp.]